MVGTAACCNDCDNKVAKEDAKIVAAEGAGKVPMTNQGTSSKCGKSIVVIYYET